MKVKSESEVAQSCLTLSNPVDCSLPGSSVHGIFQARVVEWVAIAFSVMPEHNMTNIFRGRTHVKRLFECDNQLMSHCHLNTTTVLIVFHYLSFSDEKCVIFGSEQWNAFLWVGACAGFATVGSWRQEGGRAMEMGSLSFSALVSGFLCSLRPQGIGQGCPPWGLQAASSDWIELIDVFGLSCSVF